MNRSGSDRSGAAVGVPDPADSTVEVLPVERPRRRRTAGATGWTTWSGTALGGCGDREFIGQAIAGKYLILPSMQQLERADAQAEGWLDAQAEPEPTRS
jgi:hypothetical protein